MSKTFVGRPHMAVIHLLKANGNALAISADGIQVCQKRSRFMFRMVIGLAALTAMVVALTSGNHVSGQDKRGGAPVNKGAVKGGMGGAIDVEALFRKHAGKDGTLTLEGFKKLLVELDGQQIVIGEPAKVADPGRPIIKGGGNK